MKFCRGLDGALCMQPTITRSVAYERRVIFGRRIYETATATVISKTARVLFYVAGVQQTSKGQRGK